MIFSTQGSSSALGADSANGEGDASAGLYDNPQDDSAAGGDATALMAAIDHAAKSV